MSVRRRIALSAAGLVALLLVLLALVPIVFRGPIEARARAAVSDAVAARVDWRRLDLGLFRHFPDLSLQLHDLTVVGTGVFAADTLLAAPRFRVVLDLGSVPGALRGTGPLVVRTVELERPQVRLLVLEDGTANWVITKPGAERARTGGGLDLSLEQLGITDGRVIFDNRQAGLAASLAGIRFAVSGDFGRERFTLRTRTAIDTTSLRFAGVPYLAGVRLELDAEVAADLAAKQFTLRDNRIRLNALELNAAGTLGLEERASVLHLTFAAPRAEFRELLSLVPVIYAQQFETLETSGTMSVQGHVSGRIGEGAFPSFALEATVADGSFRYPDLPLPARDIALHVALRNPGGSPDSTVVDVDRFHVVLGDDAVDGSFRVRTPLSDPDVALRVTGRVDLADVPRTVKLPDVQELSGTVAADVALAARLSDVDQERYDRVRADGRLQLDRLALRASALRQPLRIETAVLRFTPSQAELSSFRATAGASDVRMTGSLENVLGFVLRREELRGSVQLASTRFDLNEWRSGDALEVIPVPGNIDFALEAQADTVRFGQLTLGNARGALRLKDRRAVLEDFRLSLLGGELVVNGSYETTDPARPAFDVALGITDIDVPAAFAGIRTVQAFVPVARYAEGHASVQLALRGALGKDMLPLFQSLSGSGSLVTSGLQLRGFPPLERLAVSLELPQLHDPGFQDLRSSFSIEDGRLHVQPFDVTVGQFTLNVAGSNGIDQSLDYTLGLRLPRAALGRAADRAVTSIVNRTARAGFDLQAAQVITLGVHVTGTVTSPQLETRFREAAGGAVQDVAQALRESADARVDSAAASVQRELDEGKAKLLAEAEQRAAAVRAEASALAEALQREAGERADSLEARARSPAAKIGARLAAERLRKEAASKADALVREAGTRADSLVADARRRAGVSSGG